MAAQNSNTSVNFTTMQKVGMYVFVITNMLCAEEMVPGWSKLNLGWSHQTLYIVASIGGLIGGALIGGRFVLPGMIGGVLAGIGALYAVSLYLAAVTKAYSTLEALSAMGGGLPGILIGLGLARLQKRMTASPTTGAA